MPAIHWPISSTVASRVAIDGEQSAAGDDDQAIGEFEQFVEFFADDEHRAAGIAQRQQLAADLRRGADVDAPGRLGDDQHLRIGVDLAADDELLQVAARQALRRARRVRRP